MKGEVLSAGTAFTDRSREVLEGVVEAIRAGECVCVYRVIGAKNISGMEIVGSR